MPFGDDITVEEYCIIVPAKYCTNNGYAATLRRLLDGTPFQSKKFFLLLDSCEYSPTEAAKYLKSRKITNAQAKDIAYKYNQKGKYVYSDAIEREFGMVTRNGQNAYIDLSSNIPRKIMSTAEGRIDTITLHFGDHYVIDLYRSLIANMKDVKFNIVYENDADKDFVETRIREWGVKNEISFIGINGKNVSVWSRDPYVVLTVNGGSILVEPESIERNGNNPDIKRNTTYWNLGEQDMIEERYEHLNERVGISHTRLKFQGGDIRATDTEVFIGIGTILNNMEKETKDYSARSISKDVFMKKFNEVISDFELLFGKKVAVVGHFIYQNDEPVDIVEPSFHIDMIMTPLGLNSEGQRMVLVADPRMACDLIKKLSVNEIAACEQGWVVQMEELFKGYVGEKLDHPENVIGYFDWAIKIAQHIDYWMEFDSVAYRLENEANPDGSKKYEVIRVPYLPGNGKFLPYPTLTYNNSIIEEYTDESGRHIKKAYIPRFGLKVLDDKAYDVYKNAGYEVVWIDGHIVSHIVCGGINCNINETRK